MGSKKEKMGHGTKRGRPKKKRKVPTEGASKGDEQEMVSGGNNDNEDEAVDEEDG